MIAKLIAVAALMFAVGFGSAKASPMRPVPQARGCYGLKPLCPPGQHPVCVCSSYTDCEWACGK